MFDYLRVFDFNVLAFEIKIIILRNKERFCKKKASVAFADTYIQEDLQWQTKDMFSTSNSKQIKPQSFSETREASLLVVCSRNSF